MSLCLFSLSLNAHKLNAGQLNFHKPKRQQSSFSAFSEAGSTFLWDNFALTSAITYCTKWVLHATCAPGLAWRGWLGESSTGLCFCLKVILTGRSSGDDLLGWEELVQGTERPALWADVLGPAVCWPRSWASAWNSLCCCCQLYLYSLIALSRAQ